MHGATWEEQEEWKRFLHDFYLTPRDGFPWARAAAIPDRLAGPRRPGTGRIADPRDRRGAGPGARGRGLTPSVDLLARLADGIL